MPSKKSSRKTSTRRSSRKSVVHNDSASGKPDNVVALEKNMHKGNAVSGLIITIIVQGLIIYYLYNLESADCKCIKDWRHNYIKFFAVLLICFKLICIAMPSANGVKGVIMVLGLINFYAFFTYIGDLNSTHCTCAVDKQPTLNGIMEFLRWLYIVILIAAVISVIYMFFFLGHMFNSSKK